jgi:hypothetical protein
MWLKIATLVAALHGSAVVGSRPYREEEKEKAIPVQYVFVTRTLAASEYRSGE